MTSFAPRRLPLVSLLTLAAVAAALSIGGARASGAGEPATASGYDFVKYPLPACAGVGLRQSPYFTRGDCGFGEATLGDLREGADVQARFAGADGERPRDGRGDGDRPGRPGSFEIAPEPRLAGGPRRP